MNILDQIADDLINGNLTEAKRRAKKHTLWTLYRHFQAGAWSMDRAMKAAQYLKHPDRHTWRDYCDAK